MWYSLLAFCLAPDRCNPSVQSVIDHDYVETALVHHGDNVFTISAKRVRKQSYSKYSILHTNHSGRERCTFDLSSASYGESITLVSSFPHSTKLLLVVENCDSDAKVFRLLTYADKHFKLIGEIRSRGHLACRITDQGIAVDEVWDLPEARWHGLEPGVDHFIENSAGLTRTYLVRPNSTEMEFAERRH